ncbi:hypothetical protein Tco_0516801, partial [Tanacetum coccineum]
TNGYVYFTLISLPALDDIRNLIHRRTVLEKTDKEGNTIHKFPNQIKTNELFNYLRPCELVIREHVYSTIGSRDHTQAVIALMLYCLEIRQPFNLAYFIIRRMYFFRDERIKFYLMSPPSNNGELPSTKLSPRSYSRALKDDPNMSKEQRETRGMFKNLGQALHNFARMLKKGCR